MILTADSIAVITEALTKYPEPKSAMLPALTVAYRQVGHLNDELYEEIGSLIGVPAIEVAEAASFYTMFPKDPVGKYLVQVCHNLSCGLMGADGLIAYLEKRLEIEKGETTPDNLFTLVTVECLGSCATAPMMQINHDYYENLNRGEVDRILGELKTQAESEA